MSSSRPGPPQTRLSFIDSFPSRIGHNFTVSSGGYNPDEPSEYDLPLMAVTTPPGDEEHVKEAGERQVVL